MKYKNSLIFIIAFACVVFAMGSVSAASSNTTNSTGLADSSWPSYQNDASKTGQSNYTGPQTNTTKWTYNGNVTVYGSAVTGKDGNIYVASANGYLYTFSPTGKLLWYYVTRSSIYGSPTIGNDGTIYISNGANSTTYAIASNGTLIWKCTIGGYNFGSSPVIGSDGTVYISSTTDTNGKLYAIDTTGKIKWAYPTGIIRATSPVIGRDGTIYMADYNGVVYAINPDGSLKWSYNLTYTTENTAYPVTYNVNIDYNSFSMGSDGTIYIASHNGHKITATSPTLGVLFAITDTGISGVEKWNYNFGEFLYGAPAISSNGTIYVVGASGLQALDSNGRPIWPNPMLTGGISGTSLTSPAIGKDGTIYFGSGNSLYAVSPDGKLKWTYLTGNVVGSPAIDSDGTLYIGTLDGTFYAFNDIAADFTVNIVKNTTLTQQFIGSTTGKPKSWLWEFGDGTTSTQQNPTHAYKKAGSYTVMLTVELQDGTIVIRTKKINIIKMDITAPTVTIDSKGGTYKDTQHVKLTASDDSNNAMIYYTTDGSSPVNSKTRKLYSGSVAVYDSMTLKYAAVDPSSNWSPVYTVKYTILNVIYIQDASKYNSKTINKDIQAIFDAAEAGSKIVFKGSSYKNLQLVINKKLNIITTVGTKIVTDLSGSAVFLINGAKASGTSIVGFNIIANTDSGILVNNADNVFISDVRVSSNNGNAITVSGSSNTTIDGSILENSLMGVRIKNSNKTVVNRSTITGNQVRGVMIDSSTNTTVSNSSITNNGDNSSTEVDEGGIYVQNSDQVNITNNQITDNFMGISTNNVSNLNITNKNIISDNFVDGIYLTGYARNIVIKANYIQHNANGIEIDYFDNSSNVSISGNLISDSVERSMEIQILSGAGMFSTGMGVKFAYNYETATNESIQHNVIAFNQVRDIDAHDEQHYDTGQLPVGSNVTTYDIEYCCKINSKPAQIDMDQIGNVFKIYFRDGETGDIITDLPDIDVVLVINEKTYVVKTNDSMGTITVSPSDLIGSAVGSFANNQVKKLVLGQKDNQGNFVYTNTGEGFFPYTDDDNNDDDGTDDNDNTGSNDNNGQGGNGNGNEGNGQNSNGNGNNSDGQGGNDNGNGNSNDGQGTNSNGNSGNGPTTGSVGESNGDPGSSSGKVTSPTALSVGAAAASPGALFSEDSSAGQSGSSKTVQELILNKNSPWGIVVVVLLIIIVAGVYYRKDVINMIKKSKK